MITIDELDRLAALCEAATPGPWIECVETSKDGLFQFSGIVSDAAQKHIAGSVNTAADSVFIAESRTAVPALVAEVRRLRAELAEANAVLDWIADNGIEIVLRGDRDPIACDLAAIRAAMGEKP